MIEVLLGQSIDLEVEPNPNGNPYLVLIIKYGIKTTGSIVCLNRVQTERLITELQVKLRDLSD